MPWVTRLTRVASCSPQWVTEGLSNYGSLLLLRKPPPPPSSSPLITRMNTKVHCLFGVTRDVAVSTSVFLACLLCRFQSRLDRLVGLVVRRPPREHKILGSNPASPGIFSGSSHTSDLNIGTPVATLSGAWRYRVSAWAPGAIGSSLGLVCPVSVYCDWVR